MDPLHFDDDDEKDDAGKGLATEFECPECNAHNPVHDGFTFGSEVVCFYCGCEFHVLESNGKFKFKPA